MRTVPGVIGLLLVLTGHPGAAIAEPERKFSEPYQTPLITNRKAEKKGLDLKLDREALIEGEGNPANDDADEDASALGDRSTRVDWSEPLGDGWNVDPVLLNRRQDGEPDLPDDDQSDKLLGIELRNEF